MFSKVQDTLSSITGFAEHGVFDDKVKNTVRRLRYDYFEQILNMISDQQPIKQKEYSIYKLDYDSLKFEHISDVENGSEYEYHTVIDSTDKYLILNALSPTFLCNYVLDNSNKRFLFLTLNYANTLMDSAHQAAFMIDNHQKKIYMLEPNGKCDYFNNVFHQDTSEFVEILLRNYFNQLSNLGLEYKYVHIDKWNHENICINKRFANNHIGNGHCVITTLILIHLISINKITPDEAIKIFKNLSDEEILYIIQQYSLGVYNILCNKS